MNWNARISCLYISCAACFCIGLFHFSGEQLRDVTLAEQLRDVTSGEQLRDVTSGEQLRDVTSGEQLRDVTRPFEGFVLECIFLSNYYYPDYVIIGVFSRRGVTEILFSVRFLLSKEG